MMKQKVAIRWKYEIEDKYWKIEEEIYHDEVQGMNCIDNRMSQARKC